MNLPESPSTLANLLRVFDVEPVGDHRYRGFTTRATAT